MQLVASSSTRERGQTARRGQHVQNTYTDYRAFRSGCSLAAFSFSGKIGRTARYHPRGVWSAWSQKNGKILEIPGPPPHRRGNLPRASKGNIHLTMTAQRGLPRVECTVSPCTVTRIILGVTQGTGREFTERQVGKNAGYLPVSFHVHRFHLRQSGFFFRRMEGPLTRLRDSSSNRRVDKSRPSLRVLPTQDSIHP